MRVIVLGLGNVLLTDDGVGIRVVEALQARFTFSPEVEIIDGGTSAMDLLDTLARCDHLIVADAVKTGAPAGTIVRLVGEEVPAFFRTKISPHQVGLCDVLATLMLTDEQPGAITVIGIVPYSMATSVALTPDVAGKVEALVGLILGELAEMGLRPQGALPPAPPPGAWRPLDPR